MSEELVQNTVEVYFRGWEEGIQDGGGGGGVLLKEI